MVLFFNPECSKCQEAVTILEKTSCDVEIRNYLQQPPSVEELKSLVKKLGCRPADIVRVKESLFREKYAGIKMNDDDVLRMLSENPILIERPILISGDQAIIGRPPSMVLNLVRNQD